jgi:hypothetical protein
VKKHGASSIVSRKARGASRKGNYIISISNSTSLSPTISEKQHDDNLSAFCVPKGFIYNCLISKLFLRKD